MTTKCLALISLITCTLFANLAFAATLCVDPNSKDPACTQTIQAAIDKAKTGDVVKISPLPNAQAYDEQVSIKTDGITLTGASCSSTFIDGCNTTNCGLTPITIDAKNITVQNLAIRHGQPGIFLKSTALEAMLTANCYLGNTTDIRSENGANKVTISKSQFNGSGNGRDIVITADDTRIINNSFTGMDEGINIIGNNTQIINNVINVCNDNGITLVGHLTVIQQNKMTGCDGGVSVVGDFPTLQNNTLNAFSGDGFNVHCCTDVDNCDTLSCNGGTITGNKISYAFDDSSALEIYGSHINIVNNLLSYSSEDGIYYEGNSGTISKNTITNSTTENTDHAGIRVLGTNNIVSSNKVMNNGFYGIYHIDGSSNFYVSNIIANNGTTGLYIASGLDNTLNKNKITGNRGEGAGNNGTNTIITANTSKSNKTDICSGLSGTFTTFEGNVFVTGEILPPTNPRTFKYCLFNN